MTRRKPRVGSGQIVAKVYPLLQEAVEDGLKWGLSRLFKHRDSDHMTHDELLDQATIDTLLTHIMGGICERFDFRDDED